MSTHPVLQKTQGKMEKSLAALRSELSKVRTGRASTSILDDVFVDYYGTPTPISQVATLGVPEPRLITITPWDGSVISLIEKSILSSDLGLTPSNDGKIIRLPMPAMTEERRKEMVKLVKKYGEEGRIAIRHGRRDAMDDLKAQEKNKEISEDEIKHLGVDVQKLTDKFVKEIDLILEQKEKELLEV